MKSVKAVILLSPGFPANEEDTTCLPYLQDFVTAFSRLYPEIKLVVIAFQYPDKRGVYFWNGIEVYSTGGNDSKYFMRLFTWLRVFNRLGTYKREYNLNVLHSFWLTECTLIGHLFAKLFRLKHISYAIGQDVTKKNKYLKLLNFWRMSIVATSEFVAAKMLETTRYNIKTIIPFGVDENKIKVSKADKTIDILGIGSLTPLKNYTLFIEIVTQLKPYFPHLNSCIVGAGEQMDFLKQLIKKNRLEENISLVGAQQHNDVFKYMAKSKLFLHTSIYEGQSTVIIEALALGLPVVCFNVGRLHSDKKITVCNDKNEMVTRLKEILTCEVDYTPLVLQKMDDTVRAFMKLYEL